MSGLLWGGNVDSELRLAVCRLRADTVGFHLKTLTVKHHQHQLSLNGNTAKEQKIIIKKSNRSGCSCLCLSAYMPLLSSERWRRSCAAFQQLRCFRKRETEVWEKTRSPALPWPTPGCASTRRTRIPGVAHILAKLQPPCPIPLLCPLFPITCNA